jgi:NAD(P)-dependent dehydrogenase (short-subunit alcohol dehydrogenase family)
VACTPALVAAGFAVAGAILAAILISSRDSREHSPAASAERRRCRRGRAETQTSFGLGRGRLTNNPTGLSDSMSEMQAEQRSAVVFGARNLGRALIELLVSNGWAVTGVARSRSTLDGVGASGALAQEADVTDPASVYGVLERAVAAHGGVDLVVNAASAYGGERSGPFGGGPIAEADLDGFDSWAAAPARAAFSFLSASGRFAIAQGRAATLVQVTGGSARRALPGRGLWAAGSFGVRAITNAAALELRPRGIQVRLLIVDAGIQPLDGSTRGVSPEALADPRRIADAVLFLANQDARSATHELQLTPLAENWTP